MSRNARVTRVEVPPSPEVVVRELLAIFDARPAKGVRLPRRIDDWLLMALVVCLCVFAATLALHVLDPALGTLVGSAAEAGWR